MNSCDLQGVSVLLKLKQSWTLSWPECTSDAVTRIGDLIFYLFIYLFLCMTSLTSQFFAKCFSGRQRGSPSLLQSHKILLCFRQCLQKDSSPPRKSIFFDKLLLQLFVQSCSSTMLFVPGSIFVHLHSSAATVLSATFHLSTWRFNSQCFQLLSFSLLLLVLSPSIISSCLSVRGLMSPCLWWMGNT